MKISDLGRHHPYHRFDQFINCSFHQDSMDYGAFPPLACHVLDQLSVAPIEESLQIIRETIHSIRVVDQTFQDRESFLEFMNEKVRPSFQFSDWDGMDGYTLYRNWILTLIVDLEWQVRLVEEYAKTHGLEKVARRNEPCPASPEAVADLTGLLKRFEKERESLSVEHIFIKFLLLGEMNHTVHSTQLKRMAKECEDLLEKYTDDQELERFLQSIIGGELRHDDLFGKRKVKADRKWLTWLSYALLGTIWELGPIEHSLGRSVVSSA